MKTVRPLLVAAVLLGGACSDLGPTTPSVPAGPTLSSGYFGSSLSEPKDTVPTPPPPQP